MPSDEEKRAAIRTLAEKYHIDDVNDWRYAAVKKHSGCCRLLLACGAEQEDGSIAQP